MTVIANLRKGIFTVFETLAIIAFVTMLCSSLVQVFFRYVVGSSLMWTEELARLMCVLTTYFGSVVVLLAREHIRVEMIDTLLSSRASAVLRLVVDLLMAWFLLTLAYGCSLMVSATWTTFTATMGWFRMGYVYAAVAAAVLTMTLILVLDIYQQVARLAGLRPEERA